MPRRAPGGGCDLFRVRILSAYGGATAEAEPPVAATPSSQHVSTAPPPQSPRPANGGPRDDASRIHVVTRRRGHGFGAPPPAPSNRPAHAPRVPLIRGLEFN